MWGCTGRESMTGYVELELILRYWWSKVKVSKPEATHYGLGITRAFCRGLRLVDSCFLTPLHIMLDAQIGSTQFFKDPHEKNI